MFDATNKSKHNSTTHNNVWGLLASLHSVYVALMRPDGDYLGRCRAVQAAAAQYDPSRSGSGAALEKKLSQLAGVPVKLSDPQLRCFRALFVERPPFGQVTPPGERPVPPGVMDEMVPAATLHEIYLALLRPDGNYVKRLKTVQAAAAQYEPGRPESGAALEGEFTRLIGRPVKLSDIQMRCFKEILINEPAFAHIAPWDDLSTIW